MSDQRYHLVYLEATSENVGRLSRELREWLRAEGWTVEAEGLVDWLGAGEDAVPADRYGPRLERMARSLREGRHEDHVTVRDSWRMYHGSEAMEGAGCPRCRHLLGFDGDGVLGEALDAWWRHRVAPELVCSACGATAPLDRWDLDRGAAAATLAITMELVDQHDEFRNALRARFPGRWAGIYEHL
ncbi:hypothetical protein ACXET9_13990 [Brachybacterium sp. DNPG3]